MSLMFHEFKNLGLSLLPFIFIANFFCILPKFPATIKEIKYEYNFTFTCLKVILNIRFNYRHLLGTI